MILNADKATAADRPDKAWRALTRPRASSMLRAMLAIGVQTWGTDVAALRHYWTVADESGYARISYGAGVGAWRPDGWPTLAALGGLTRRRRMWAALK